MNLIEKVITAVMIITTIVACSHSVCSAATYDTDRISIYIIGDSIMAGTGNTKPATSVYKDTFKTYNKIEKESNKKCAGIGFYLQTSMNCIKDSKGNVTKKTAIYDTITKNKIYCTQKRDLSKGGSFICGNTSGEIYSQVVSTAKRIKSDKAIYAEEGRRNRTVVLIDGSANDILKKTKACPTHLSGKDDYKAHAKLMYNYMLKIIAVDSDAKFIYILPTHISNYLGSYKKSFDGYEKYLRTYVTNNKSLNGHVEFIKTTDAISNSSSYIQSDKLHLKEAGYLKVVNKILASDFMKRHKV